MGDEFDQYKISSATSGGDEFAQYKLPSPVESPIAPPPIKLSAQPMSQSPLGATDYSDPSIPQFGGMHGGSYDIAFRNPQGQISPDTIKAMAAGGSAGVAAGLVPGSARAIAPVAAAFAAKHPYIAGAIASEAVNQARRLPVVGKMIPPGSEVIAGLLAGSKGAKGAAKGAAAEEGAVATPALEGEGQSVQIGRLPTAKGNPYSGPRTPSSMEVAQSSNIQLHGYEPNSQTLMVQFKNGRVYEYRGVPQEIYDAYRTDPASQGSFFAQNIKGRYDTTFRGTVKPTTGQKVAAALSGK